MAVNYSKPLPQDRNNVPMVGSPPAFVALQATDRENAAASSVTSFNDNTTVIEIAAIGAPAVIKWATNQATSVISASGTENFDNIILTGATRLLVVPRRVQAIASIVGLNIQEGLYNGIATKSIGTGSVLFAQF